jgi:hypothetical protein
MLGSPQVLRTSSILIECTSFQRLKQVSWARYARIKMFLLEHGYVMGSVDKTLFTLQHGTDFLLVQIYVDDIIFDGSSHTLMSRF